MNNYSIILYYILRWLFKFSINNDTTSIYALNFIFSLLPYGIEEYILIQHMKVSLKIFFFHYYYYQLLLLLSIIIINIIFFKKNVWLRQEYCTQS
jgi:hypothetical protein